MNRNIDHERFAEQNRRAAENYTMEKTDKALVKKGFDRATRQDEPSCYNCKLNQRCAVFNKQRGVTGAASVSAEDKHLCERYVPAPPSEKKGMNDKQVKNLLKSAMKGKLR
jgi:hypothetical protein